MSNKKNTKANIAEDILLKSAIEPTTDTENIIEVEDPRVDEYEVILARPTYYIINKNGVNELINESNNYKKGDIVTL